MLTLEETILNGRKGWHTLTVEDVDAVGALNRKHDIVESGLSDGTDFVWGYRQSEYDGFTMHRPRHAVYAFRDPAMASFFRLKWT